MPLIHPGPHMYVRCRYPSDAEINDENMTVIELTSSVAWNPGEVENSNALSEDELMLAVAKSKKQEPIWEENRAIPRFLSL